MKILLLCKKFPFPLKDGESIAIHTLSKSLHELGCQVSLLAMNTSKHYYSPSTYPEDIHHYHRIETVNVDNRIKIWPAFRNLFTSESYHIERFVSPAFSAKLADMLQGEDYDVVQLETLYLAPYIPTIRQHSQSLIAMRAHNVEHEIWDRIVGNTATGPKRWYLSHLTDKLKRFEQQALTKYDMLLPITGRDLRHFRSLGYKAPATVIPIGIPTDAFQAFPVNNKQSLSISFIGSLDWMPNLEGLHWFIQKVWPDLRRKFPALELHIAGRNTPKSLLQLNKPNIKVHGEVPDSATFIHQHPFMVVPLLSGSGMRAKILEGMALGKVVLSTSIGLEGISATDRKEVIIANTADQFVEGLTFALKQQATNQAIGQHAQAFVYREYESRAIASKLLAAYNEQLVGAI